MKRTLYSKLPIHVRINWNSHFQIRGPFTFSDAVSDSGLTMSNLGEIMRVRPVNSYSFAHRGHGLQ